MSAARDEFFRRYATSPIHVPRLERLLSVYEVEEEDDFCRSFIAWDRACRDSEAARIVAEILCVTVDRAGGILRLSDAAVRGAIRWMANATWLAPADRLAILRDLVQSRDDALRGRAIEFLETAPDLDDATFRDSSRLLVAVQPPGPRSML
jgi:hypothetical protein